MIGIKKWIFGIMVHGCILFIVSLAYGENSTSKTLSPYFFIENGDPAIDRFPLKSTRVNVKISGVIADVTVLQGYTNDGTRPINARYIFPASTRAAVHGMVMKIGENIIRAEVKERETAQQEFNQAKKQGKSASLLKQQRPNVFSMSLANIMPGDKVDIELHYTELLVPTDHIYEFIYPTVVGPRYSGRPLAEAPEGEHWIQNPYLKEGRETETEFTMEVGLSSGIPLQEIICPSHETATVWESESTAKISLSASEKNGGNRDFILNYRLAGEEIQSGLLLYKGEEENFFLLMAQPPQRVAPPDIPPREYIFVVDVSGSMNGFPINTAKKLLNNLIGSLKATDTFNIILFAGNSALMSPVSLPAAEENIQRAIRLIERQQGGGGTELYAALKRSLSLPRDEKVSRTVLIISDGYIAAEKDVFQLIRQNLNRTNFFAFGIGSSVNRYLIEGVARAGLGRPFIVTGPREARATAVKFQEYVSSPVLTDVMVKFNGFETYDLEPPSIPDLFAQRPVLVFGKWRGRQQGTIEVRGTCGKGEYVRVFEVTRNQSTEINRALPYLWARTRLGRLSDFNSREKDPENKARITSLGLSYNLLTAYTSFIAVHEVIRNPDGSGEEVKQPLPLPKGVSNLAVGASCSKVPEPGIYVVVGILTLALVIRITRGRLWPVQKIIRNEQNKV